MSENTFVNPLIIGGDNLATIFKYDFVVLIFSSKDTELFYVWTFFIAQNINLSVCFLLILKVLLRYYQPKLHVAKFWYLKIWGTWLDLIEKSKNSWNL